MAAPLVAVQAKTKGDTHKLPVTQEQAHCNTVVMFSSQIQGSLLVGHETRVAVTFLKAVQGWRSCRRRLPLAERA